jgi:hypothetical protein
MLDVRLKNLKKVKTKRLGVNIVLKEKMEKNGISNISRHKRYRLFAIYRERSLFTTYLKQNKKKWL